MPNRFLQSREFHWSVTIGESTLSAGSSHFKPGSFLKIPHETFEVDRVFALLLEQSYL
jgi:hypothetical protein